MTQPANKHRCIIVDDNKLDGLTILSFVRKYPFIQVDGLFESALVALEFAHKVPPDILLLDIDMPGLNGLDLRRELSHIPACIFITSHPEFALEGFETAAFDYIVKPIMPHRFEKAMARLQQFLEVHHKAALLDYTLGEDTLFIKDGYDHVKLQLHEIIYLEALKDYTGIVTREKKYCVLTPLGTLLREKAFQTFIRIHRSYAVQKHFIDKITPREVMINDLQIPVGRSYKASIDKLLKS